MVDRKEFRFEFSCPRCTARLRLKDRSLLGTQWTCPECGCSLRIEDAGEGQVAALDVTPLDPKLPPVFKRRVSPKWAARLVALVLLAGLTVLIVQRPGKRKPVANDPPQPVTPLPVPTNPVVVTEISPAKVDPAMASWEAIGRWLTSQRERNGAFPAATMGEGPLEDRFGWQAQFREETTGLTIPDRTKGWRSPINDSFVRRKAAVLLLPGLPVASEAGFPASNFAGVSGVGPDAARLPKSDPRAGIFGHERRTTTADVRDGLSNTMMIVGVEGKPPTWASGAEGVRSLTAEPYIGGPDGLGTGRKDGMYVLMADGSVKFLASQTDPKLLRRMAAMADGLPLDASVPGEPEPAPRVSPNSPHVADGAPAASKNDPPITVELAPDHPPVDVAKQLSIPLRRFRLSQPTPLRTVLRQLVEMSALPIDASAVEPIDRLDLPITLDHEDAPLAEILAAALKPAGLSYSMGAGTIHLIEAPPTTKPDTSTELREKSSTAPP